MPDENIIELICKICGEKVLTKEYDSLGNKITEILCWNCISLDLEDRSTQRYLHEIKSTSKIVIKDQKMAKDKPLWHLSEEVFVRLPDKFIYKNIADIMVDIYKTNRNLGFKNKTKKKKMKHLETLKMRWVQKWAERGLIEQHNPGRHGTYFTKIVKNNEQNVKN